MHRFLFLFISVFFLCCQSNPDLSGSWSGLQMIKGDSIYNKSFPDRCSLNINENHYFFRGNTGVIEKGMIEISEKYLTIQDTLRNNGQKNIQYEMIGSDTLQLTMNDQNEALILVLKKD